MDTAITDLLQKLANTAPDHRAEVFGESLLSDACSVIEMRGQQVTYLLMPPDTEVFLGPSLWGTRVLYSEDTPENTGYAIGDGGSSACFTWETLPEAPKEPKEPVVRTEMHPDIAPQGHHCPHCGKQILVTLLKVET
jgi:hypothetical protein